MDVVAMLVMGILGLTGLITPEEALSGFSNPAVITVWAMFILSAALYQTGVARIISRQLLNFTGTNQLKMVALVMLTSGIMSGFINNIGVAALMLPVVMDLSRATSIAPSRLLIPLVFGCHLGGLTTLIGTPPNLLISYALRAEGHQPFSLFDFTPVGFGAMLGGILFMAFVGRKLLPERDSMIKGHSKDAIPSFYALQERTFSLKVKPSSPLVNKTLAQSRLRAGLGINVLSIIREDNSILDPGPNTTIKAHDKLFVSGRMDAITALQKWRIHDQQQNMDLIKHYLQWDLDIFEAVLAEKSPLENRNLLDKDFSSRLNINLLAVLKGQKTKRTRLREHRFTQADLLLLQGSAAQLEILRKEGSIESFRKIPPKELTARYRLHEVLFILETSAESRTYKKETLEEEIGNSLGLSVLAKIDSDDQPRLIEPYSEVKPGDKLLAKGFIKDLPLISSLKDLEVSEERIAGTQSLESDRVQLAEVVLAPRSLMEGKTLREVNFRKKFGLTVLAIWREGRAHRTHLHNIPLRFGEALLLYGQREKIEQLNNEPDLILLTEKTRKPIRPQKAIISLLIMIGVLVPVVTGLVPLAISAIIGVVAMVLTGCLKMEEAYQSIEWRSVFLIAGMLPLGIAMQKTGAASLLAESILSLLGNTGPYGIIAGLYLITSLTALAIPPPALVVIMSPIALQAAASFDISPQSLMMAVAIAAASTFMSPVSHPANLLIMGPGGYKFKDFVRVGVPFNLVIMIIVLLLLPVFWPV